MADGSVIADDEHAAVPSIGRTLTSLALLLIALVDVVGDAKLVSPTIERVVVGAGFPVSRVSVSGVRP